MATMATQVTPPSFEPSINSIVADCMADMKSLVTAARIKSIVADCMAHMVSRVTVMATMASRVTPSNE